jgi:hypothetical protein
VTGLIGFDESIKNICLCWGQLINKQTVLIYFGELRLFTVFFGEFDSGSERTLAAWIRHASRTGSFELNLRREIKVDSGGRVSNAWVSYPQVGDNSAKAELIPDVVSCRMAG